jgi:hypothetical protein
MLIRNWVIMYMLSLSVLIYLSLTSLRVNPLSFLFLLVIMQLFFSYGEVIYVIPT